MLPLYLWVAILNLWNRLQSSTLLKNTYLLRRNRRFELHGLIGAASARLNHHHHHSKWKKSPENSVEIIFYASNINHGCSPISFYNRFGNCTEEVMVTFKARENHRPSSEEKIDRLFWKTNNKHKRSHWTSDHMGALVWVIRIIAIYRRNWSHSRWRRN